MYNADLIEEINDENLFLRKISKQDAKFLFNSLNMKDLTTYLSLGPLSTLDYSKRLIRSYLKYWEKFTQFNYIIEVHQVKKEKIGSISLWNVNWRHMRAEIGIWIVPTFWNKGYGEKAINLIKIIGFNHLHLKRLEAHIAIDNTRSIILFKKCGFKEEGILKSYLHFNGAYYNAMVLSCIRTYRF